MNKEKKVLFVATVTSHIKAFHIPYLKYFKEKGYEVHVASNGEEKIKYCDKHFNINFNRFPLSTSNIRAYTQLKNIINDNKYEIIHCHTPVASALTRLAARKARKKFNTKVLYTAHGFHFYKGAPIKNWLMYYPIEKICSIWTDCLITITYEDYNLAKRKFKAKKIEHIDGIGFNVDKFNIKVPEEDKENLYKEIGANKNDVILTYVAELNKNKNQIILINLIEKIIKNNSNIKLLLVGDGKLNDEYQKIVKEKKLDKHIIFLGRRNDISQILSISDIYVASSIREGLPINIMEAMYMSLPIVATANRGHNELLENGSGYIVHNEKEFYERVLQLINSNELRKEIGDIAKHNVEKYKLNLILSEMEKIYIEIQGENL